ncbi:MAG TPA: hypothetical protein PLW65_32290, partial [Pseudomonadota bacterium]|nr:hypothetical protein [Pseudomonadota bacterium]
MKLPTAPKPPGPEDRQEPGRREQRPSRPPSPESEELLSTDRGTDRGTSSVQERGAAPMATPHPCAPLLGESRAAAA